jgi:hypothetical protein
VSDESETGADWPDFRAWLRGKIAFVKMAHPDVGNSLLARSKALDQKDPKG